MVKRVRWLEQQVSDIHEQHIKNTQAEQYEVEEILREAQYEFDAANSTLTSDSLLLRGCAREENYNHLQIIIYDFSQPRLNIPYHILPQTKHPTTLSVIHSDNPTIVNVLVDMGNAQRQVLVRDYDVGKAVAFDQRILNLKEVYTLDGYKMFSYNAVQTILPPNKSARNGRFCGAFDYQIRDLERDTTNVQEQAQQCRRRKRVAVEKLKDLQGDLQSVKRRRLDVERDFNKKRITLQDVKNLFAPEPSSLPASTVELHQEISNVQAEIQEKKILWEKLEVRMAEAVAKARDLKLSFENLCESAKDEIDAFEKAEKDLMKIEKDLTDAELKAHYEGIMNIKVLLDINEAEALYWEFERNHKENHRKASVICPESEIDALGDWDGSTIEQLSAQLNRLNQRLKHESQCYSESVDDLRMLYEKKELKIIREQQIYKAFRGKLNACQKALELRWRKFQRNAILLKHELTWK